MSEPDSLGKILSYLRKNRKVTLRDVELATGISNSYLSQLEYKGIREPSPIKLEKLSEYYQYSYAVLMKAAGYKYNEKDESCSCGFEKQLIKEAIKHIEELL